jgi:carbonic anhydrase/acetyltransferase-like protein (isoleucine patch superfamily)
MHYELTQETTKWQGSTLYRIRALKDMPQHGVKAGDLGGFIQHRVNLVDSAWVGGEAKVKGNATVSGYASMSGNSEMTGYASMSGGAQLENYARLSDNATLLDRAKVGGSAWVFGNASMSGNSRMVGNARMFDNAKLSGDAEILEHGCVAGDVILSQGASIVGIADIRNQSEILVLGPAVSSGRYLTAYRTRSGLVLTNTGCFRGSVAELVAAVNKTHSHPDNEPAYNQYMGFINQINQHFKGL